MSIPPEFIIFGMTLVGVAAYHHHASAALAGLLGASVYSAIVFPTGIAGGFSALAVHSHEAVLLSNLLFLLLGFAFQTSSS